MAIKLIAFLTLLISYKKIQLASIRNKNTTENALLLFHGNKTYCIFDTPYLL